MLIRRLIPGLILGCCALIMTCSLQAQIQIEADLPALRRGTYTDSALWHQVAEFCDAYPRRLSGTTVLEEGLDWIIARMQQQGWSVRTQPAMVPTWIRGAESLRMLSAPSRPLPMMGLGGSVGTNGTPIKAEVLVVRSFEELDARGAEARGKIVVWNVPFTTYGETVQYRYGGASAAAAHGAVASLTRSVGPYGMQTPHTGGMGYREDVQKIPSAAITMEDAMLMQRMQDRGQSIELELMMEARSAEDRPSRNIIIEIPGSEHPEEVVVMGGHIDAWDVGTGAMDDASGCFVTWHALNAIKGLGKQPKRTIRVCFWTNEENGLRGGKAYADLTAHEQHVLAMEVDGGTFQPVGFSGSVEGSLKADVEALLQAGITTSPKPPTLVQGGGGADTGPLRARGVPVIELVVDTSKYFWYHHTEADTPDKLDPRELNDCAYAMAVMAWGIANR